MNWLDSLPSVLTASQIVRLSNIFDNAGQVVLAVVALSPIIGGVDKVNAPMLLWGLLSVCLCWLVSIWLARKGGKE